MSLLGTLEDVSLVDVMQFVHLGGHSGTLHLERGHERASIGFHHGRIVSAGTADSKRVGELLCEAEALSAEALSQALDQQHKTVPRQSLGRILIERGFVSEDQMRRAMESQVQKSVLDLTTWSHGSFEFVLNEMEPVDDISFYPGDFVPLVDLNTQLVLLEAARIFDERSHRAPAGEAREAAPEEARSETQPEASSRDGVPYVQVVSSDDLLAERLRGALAYDSLRLARVPLREAGTPPPGEGPPLVVLDLRPRASLDAVRALRKGRPRVPIVAVVDGQVNPAEIYRAGAIAALPADAETIASYVRHFSRNCGEPTRSAGRRGSSEPRFAKLRRIFSDLRTGALSSTIALSLMTVIAESLERAILFLVQGDRLTILGSFGYAEDLEPLSRRTKGLSVRLDEEHAISRCVAEARARTVTFDDTVFPIGLSEILGRPRSGQAAVFPVMGGQRVIAVIYADNARSNRAIEEIDFLELAMMQVGLAFENELLRRKAAARR